MVRLSILLVVLALGGIGCDRRTAPAVVVGPGPGAARAESSESYPSKEEVLDYLDGKTISRTDPPAKDELQFTLRRDQVEALEIDKSGTSVNDGPWTTNVTLIAKSDETRYAVKLTVKHRRIEDKRAFFGFHVSEVARQ